MGSYLDLDDVTFGHPKAENELHLMREHIKGVELEIRNAKLKYLKVLLEIQGMCIGNLCMSYGLDANYIGQLIAEATGMNNPDLNKYYDELQKS